MSFHIRYGTLARLAKDTDHDFTEFIINFKFAQHLINTWSTHCHLFLVREISNASRRITIRETGRFAGQRSVLDEHAAGSKRSKSDWT